MGSKSVSCPEPERDVDSIGKTLERSHVEVPLSGRRVATVYVPTMSDVKASLVDGDVDTHKLITTVTLIDDRRITLGEVLNLSIYDFQKICKALETMKQ